MNLSLGYFYSFSSLYVNKLNKEKKSSSLIKKKFQIKLRKLYVKCIQYV
jgi:hypothetical protein